MDDLPELPFEQVLSYLSLEDRLKSRAVSRRWYWKINRFKVKSLCYSSRPSGFVYGKSRLVSGAFAQNFISSPRFASFFNAFGQSILSNLKHLRLCDLRLNAGDRTAFASNLQSFDQLKELDLIRLDSSSPRIKFELNLPMLNSIQIEKPNGVEKLTLDAPGLQKVKLVSSCNFKLDLVHAESVERLDTQCLCSGVVQQLRNLKNLKILKYHVGFNSTFLSGLEQLKEIHLSRCDDVLDLFEQKKQHRRVDLKIFLWGVLLDGPDDPMLSRCRYFDKDTFDYLAENPTRLIDEIPFISDLSYNVILSDVPGTEIAVLKRLTDLNELSVVRPAVNDIQRFWDILKNLDLVELRFWWPQGQDLFDRLPDHCAVQDLTINRNEDLDVRFLSRLKNLIRVHLDCSINRESIREVLEELPFLSYFYFWYIREEFVVEIDHPKRFQVINRRKRIFFSDLNAAIQFIENTEEWPSK